jgi:hypothetical protein
MVSHKSQNHTYLLQKLDGIRKDIGFRYSDDITERALYELLVKILIMHPVWTYLSIIPPDFANYIREVCWHVSRATGVRIEDISSYLSGRLPMRKIKHLMRCQCPCRNHHRVEYGMLIPKPLCGCCKRHDR